MDHGQDELHPDDVDGWFLGVLPWAAGFATRRLGLNNIG